jgi:PAS domain S-box-containing protein
MHQEQSQLDLRQLRFFDYKTIVGGGLSSNAFQQNDFALVLEQVDHAIALFAPNLTLAQFNDPWVRLWDLEPAWLQSCPPLDTIVAELVMRGCWSEKHRLTFETALKKLGHGKTCLTFEQGDGTQIEMKLAATSTGGLLMVCDRNMESSFLASFDPDHSEKAQPDEQFVALPEKAQAKLRRSEATYRALVQAIPDLLIRMTRDGTYLDFIPAKYFAVVKTAPDMRGKHISEVMPPDIVRERLFYAEQALKTGQIQVHEFQLRTSDGVRFQEARIAVSGDDEVLVIIRDITDRKQIEVALHQSEARYRAIVEDQTELICRFLPDGTLTFVNQAYCRYFGKHSEELIGYSFLPLMPVEDQPIVREQLATLSASNPVVTYEHRVILPNGEVRYQQWTDRVILDGQGQIVEYQAVGHDITERKRLENALWQANTELGIKVEEQIVELNVAIAQLQQEMIKRQQAQEALYASEERYRSMVAALHEGILLQDAEHRFLTCNASAEKILGISAEQIQGQTVDEMGWQFIQADGLPYEPDDCPVLTTLRTGLSCSAVVVGLRKTADAEVIWLSINSQPLFHEGESVPYAVVTSFSEVTARRQAETQLRESEERFRQLTDNIQEVFWMRDIQTGQVLYISPAFETIWQRSCDSIYEDQTLWIESIHPEDRDRVQNAMQTHQADRLEYRIVKPDGSIRWIRDRAFPIHDATGQIYRVAGVAEDITQIKQQEDRLRLLESVVINANDAIVITESTPISAPGPHILYVNEAFCRLTGYTAEEVIGKTPRLLQGAKTDRDVLRKVRTALENWQPIVVELINYRKDRSEFWVELSIVPVADKMGWYTHWVSIQRDITQRKRLEAKLLKTLQKERELSELKSHFVTSTSHEFRTPLSIILSSAELLEHYGHQWKDHDKQEHLRLIQSTVKRMTQLLEDILLIGKAEAGKLEFRPTPVEIKPFCRELLVEMQRGMGREHRLILECDDQIGVVQLDEKLLRQILQNLLSNAIKYSEPGSLVQLSVSRRSDRLHFQIKDEGIGIPLADQPRLFESFRRAENVSGIPGTGLGLAIAKHCVDLHGGDIRFSSELGVGTTFAVMLPI